MLAIYENLFSKIALDFQNFHKLSHSKITRYTVLALQNVINHNNVIIIVVIGYGILRI